jgi:hypothetical protein
VGVPEETAKEHELAIIETLTPRQDHTITALIAHIWQPLRLAR